MSAWIYSLLTRLYPADLRAEFGVEMMQVFLEDLEEHRQRSGFSGIASVWWRTLMELCCLAPRDLMNNHRIAVPVIVYGLQELAVMVAYIGHPYFAHPGPVTSLKTILSGSFVSPGFIPASAAFLAVVVANHDQRVLLKLER